MRQPSLNLPTSLSAYDVKLFYDEYKNILICELVLNDNVFYSEITESDIKSGMINLAKLSNIIKSNSKLTQPYFTIWIDSNLLDTNDDSNNIVLNIKFSNDYFDYAEQIYFQYKNKLLSEQMSNNKKLEQIIETQSQKIIQLTNTIGDMNGIIEKLSNRLDKLESEQFVNCMDVYTNNHVLIDDIEGNITKKINKLNLMKLEIIKNRMASFNHLVASFNISISDVDFCYLYPKHNIIGWSKSMLFFDIDIIETTISETNNNTSTYSSTSWTNRLEYTHVFLNTYLGEKINFRIQEIIIDDIDLLKTIIKYTNYDKLTIKNNTKFFNDKLIKSHCETNNIIFEY